MSVKMKAEASIFVVSMACGAAYSQTAVSWSTAGNGNWGTASNWSTGVVPNNSGSSTYLVDLNAPSALSPAYTVSLNQYAEVDRLRMLSSKATLDLAGNSLLVEGDVYLINGLLTRSGASGVLSIDGELHLGGVPLIDAGEVHVSKSVVIEDLPDGPTSEVDDIDLCDTCVFIVADGTWNTDDNIRMENGAGIELLPESSFIISGSDSRGIISDGSGGIVNEGELVLSMSADFLLDDSQVDGDSGSLFFWTGSGNIEVENDGQIAIGTGADIRITGSSSKSISTTSTGTFILDGELEMDASSTVLFEDIDFEVSGDVLVKQGVLRLDVANDLTPSAELADGAWEIHNSAELDFAGDTFDTLSASVVLSGASSIFDAIDPLAYVESGGYFEINSGHNFTTAGDFEIAAGGEVVVGSGSTLMVTGTFANYNRGFHGGRLKLEGHLVSAPGSFRLLNHDLELVGTNAGLYDFKGNNQLGDLATIAPDARLCLTDGSQYEGDSLDVWGQFEVGTDPSSMRGITAVRAHRSLELYTGSACQLQLHAHPLGSQPLIESQSIVLHPGMTLKVSPAVGQAGLPVGRHILMKGLANTVSDIELQIEAANSVQSTKLQQEGESLVLYVGRIQN